MLGKLVYIGLGGGCGAICRYGLAGLAQHIGGAGFPAGTLLVNCAGCLLAGLLNAAFLGPALLSDELRMAVLVGFLGGMTTFSTFGWETFSLANDGSGWSAVINLLLNNTLALTSVWLGYRLGERVFGL